MKNVTIVGLAMLFICSAYSADLVPNDICGNWETPIRKKLRWDHPYESVSLHIRPDGRCPLVLGPPVYGARLVIQPADEPDRYHYQIEDGGKVVEEGILRYLRIPDMLSFEIFGSEVRLARAEKLLGQQR